MKKYCIIPIIVIFVLTSCRTSNSKVVVNDSLDTTGFRVDFDIVMAKNLLFIPNYFDKIYGVGNKYEDAIDAWTKLRYSDAERMLLEVESAINNSSKRYYPDDIAFVKEALGILYCDIANYNKAYEYLIDAYVTIHDVYDNKKDIVAKELFYAEAISIALCHYYYSVGNYDGCLIEIEKLRNINNEMDLELTDETKPYLLFISYITNDIEASIYNDRGEYDSAYKLYYENFSNCTDYTKKEKDSTFGYVIGIYVCEHLADCFNGFTEPEFAERKAFFYNLALKWCDYFNGDLMKTIKSRILIKKGKYLLNFLEQQEEAQQAIDDGVAIQEDLLSKGKHSPDDVEIYIALAEINGFPKNNKNKALMYYEKAEELSKTIYGEYHPYTAMVYESMGRYYGNRIQDFDQAIVYSEKGVEVYRNLLIENNPKVANMYFQLAGCYKIKGEKELSDECLKKAYSINHALGIRVLQTDGTWK